MVLSRTIDNLKERPRHEREAVAFWISLAVVIILLLAWGIFFFRSIGSSNLHPVNDAYMKATQEAQDQAAQAADDTGWVSNASQTAGAASAPDQIQIIQEDDVPQAADPTDPAQSATQDTTQ